MKTALILAILLFSSIASAPAQTTQNNDSRKKTSVAENSISKNKQPTAQATARTPSQTTTYVRPTSKQRFNQYVKSIVGPTSLVKRAAISGLNTFTNAPEEWGQDWKGFGRRFVSNMGRSAIRNTTAFALEETFKLDSRFYRSQKRDVGSRLRNALISPVAARDENGNRVFGFPRLVGTYAAGFIAAETWYPKRFDYKNGLRSGSVSLGVDAAINVVREFVFKKKK